MGSAQEVVKREDFISTMNAIETDLFKLENGTGMEVLITNYGARIVAIRVPDANGNIDDVALGFDNVARYAAGKDHAFGATIGRYANRIGGATFELNGKRYHLEANKPPNCLHSGKASWMYLAWKVASHSPGHLTLEHVSPDGEGGFPSTVHTSVTYSLSDNNVLRIVFNAESENDTVVNMTNHSYFNLLGAGKGEIFDHEIRIHARAVTATDSESVPTGEMKPVDGTPLDLRNWKNHW